MSKIITSDVPAIDVGAVYRRWNGVEPAKTESDSEAQAQLPKIDTAAIYRRLNAKYEVSTARAAAAVGV